MHAAHPAKTIEVLLVEDSPSDVRLMQEALIESGVSSRLHVVRDGAQAMQFLRNEPPLDHAPRPDLIFLDLNLPRMSGREVLSEIKRSRDLSTIPVCILTTSSNQQDVDAAYALNATCYITKPSNLDDFVAQVKTIYSFWFRGA